MDMCYDGTLVMPSSYAVMDEDEMSYVEGGGSITINRSSIKKAIGKVFQVISGISTIAWLANAQASQIAGLVAKSAIAIGKAILSVGGFAGFAIQAICFAFAGVVLASAMTIGIVYATNSTMTLRW